MRERIEPYTALIVQPEVTVVEDREGIQRNLDRVMNLIHFGVGYFWEVPVRLVVLPEYFLQGVGTPGKGESKIEDQMKKAGTSPGPESDQRGEIAKQYGLYICGGGVVHHGDDHAADVVTHVLNGTGNVHPFDESLEGDG